MYKGVPIELDTKYLLNSRFLEKKMNYALDFIIKENSDLKICLDRSYNQNENKGVECYQKFSDNMQIFKKDLEQDFQDYFWF